MLSLNGFGTRLYGSKKLTTEQLKKYPVSKNSCVTTKWFVLFYFPIVPLSSYIVVNKANKENLYFGAAFFFDRKEYSLIELPKIDKKQVLYIYLSTPFVILGILGIACAILALFFLYIMGAQYVYEKTGLFLLILFVVSPIIIIFLLIYILPKLNKHDDSAKIPNLNFTAEEKKLFGAWYEKYASEYKSEVAKITAEQSDKLLEEAANSGLELHENKKWLDIFHPELSGTNLTAETFHSYLRYKHKRNEKNI